MSYINFIKKVFTGTGSDNTPEGALIRTGGKQTTKLITLSANNTSDSVNVFELTGSVEVLSLHGEVTDATTLNNCTAVYFDLWDGTVSVPLSKVTGAALSGCAVGSFFIRDSDSSTELSVLNNNQARVKEAATGTRLRSNFIITQKASTTTYIRFRYTTTDTPINAQITIGITYADIDGGEITAV